MEVPPLGLYIHLPWCERKCPYCDFNSHETLDLPEYRYVDSLLRDLREDLPLTQDRQVQTLFIGGGTPSLFSTEAIARLLTGIADQLSLAVDLEATMEANPGSAEAGKFLGFRQAGINRLSLGIQSFDDHKLAALGRVHNGDQARAAIDMTRAAGFDSFNIDLMHGLPGQSPRAALADLHTALGFKPPHLSWYQLTIEPNTVFHKRPPQLPAEDTLADIQQQGEAMLVGAGYRQYEVSAYSQPGFNCRHNRNYWSFGDYLGIGAGAHGKISFPDGRILRYTKTRQPLDYLAAAPGGFTASRRNLHRDEIAGEFMLNALRLNEGFTLAHFTSCTGLVLDDLQPQLNSLVQRKLLAWPGDRVFATGLGRRFLDSVIAEFFPY
jgi:oxygen-independent coproporphyrinogen-3 oxidase